MVTWTVATLSFALKQCAVEGPSSPSSQDMDCRSIGSMLRNASRMS